MKNMNPWGKSNQKKPPFPPAKYGVGKYGGARVGSRRPGARGK
ncbi:MAG TPA: hypothetical protein VI957_01440 [Candidatus Paceibacterota bacterium]